VKDGEIVSARCDCLKIRKSIKLLKESGLQLFVNSKTFDNYEETYEWQKYVKEMAKRFISQNEIKWFFIGGQVGSGKSHICTAMCSHFISEGKPTRYMLWTDVSKKLKANINEDTYAEIIQPYKDVEVLYIDDFFKVRKGQLPTNADVNIAFDILNTRLFSKEKVTIISSEFTLNKLLSVDEATISRIVENAKHFVVNLEEDSKKNYRFKK
jgi:DNA replication protein DnaC